MTFGELIQLNYDNIQVYINSDNTDFAFSGVERWHYQFIGYAACLRDLGLDYSSFLQDEYEWYIESKGIIENRVSDLFC